MKLALLVVQLSSNRITAQLIKLEKNKKWPPNSPELFGNENLGNSLKMKLKAQSENVFLRSNGRFMIEKIPRI